MRLDIADGGVLDIRSVSVELVNRCSHHFQVFQLFRGDIGKQVFGSRVLDTQAPRKTLHRGFQLTLRPAALFLQEGGIVGVRFDHLFLVQQLLFMFDRRATSLSKQYFEQAGVMTSSNILFLSFCLKTELFVCLPPRFIAVIISAIFVKFTYINLINLDFQALFLSFMENYCIFSSYTI